jgi:hypothetical protein
VIFLKAKTVADEHAKTAAAEVALNLAILADAKRTDAETAKKNANAAREALANTREDRNTLYLQGLILKQMKDKKKSTSK